MARHPICCPLDIFQAPADSFCDKVCLAKALEVPYQALVDPFKFREDTERVSDDPFQSPFDTNRTLFYAFWSASSTKNARRILLCRAFVLC